VQLIHPCGYLTPGHVYTGIPPSAVVPVVVKASEIIDPGGKRYAGSKKNIIFVFVSDKIDRPVIVYVDDFSGYGKESVQFLIAQRLIIQKRILTASGNHGYKKH